MVKKFKTIITIMFLMKNKEGLSNSILELINLIYQIEDFIQINFSEISEGNFIHTFSVKDKFGIRINFSNKLCFNDDTLIINDFIMSVG